MKILVAVSKAPDTTSKVSFKDGDTKFNEDGVQWIINPYDEWYSLVRAVELKEADPQTVIHLVTVGDASNDAILRKALALGGDEAIRINADASDSYNTAAQIAEVAKQGNYDLIFTGKETIDYNAMAVGSMIAGLLDLPYVSAVAKFDLQGNDAIAIHEIEGGEETVQITLPAVISSTKGMAKQRIPNMRGIMAARSKPIKVVEPIASDNLTEIVQYELPPAKESVKLIDANNVEELVRILHEDVKVI
ncbi:MAG: electron transfer flavoprotein subunit beta/FixA family protein [Arachidicoccus sp.]|nr:electron transfer flavoprotein subunit beta/FixA family protein [Arachidicoccus sp.]